MYTEADTEKTTERQYSSDSRFIGQLDERLQNEFTKNLSSNQICTNLNWTVFFICRCFFFPSFFYFYFFFKTALAHMNLTSHMHVCGHVCKCALALIRWQTPPCSSILWSYSNRQDTTCTHTHTPVFSILQYRGQGKK